MEQSQLRQQTDHVIMDALRASGRTLAGASELGLLLLALALLLSPFFWWEQAAGTGLTALCCFSPLERSAISGKRAARRA